MLIPFLNLNIQLKGHPDPQCCSRSRCRGQIQEERSGVKHYRYIKDVHLWLLLDADSISEHYDSTRIIMTLKGHSRSHCKGEILENRPTIELEVLLTNKFSSRLCLKDQMQDR